MKGPVIYGPDVAVLDATVVVGETGSGVVVLTEAVVVEGGCPV
jgi:hypothetical protein